MEEPKPDRFAEFLVRKNIDAESFSLAEPAIFQKWKELFSQLHEESFLMMQKFRLNPLRRRFPLVRHASVHPALQPGSE
jgi:hypothetical protein